MIWESSPPPMSCRFHNTVHVVGHQDIVIKLKRAFLLAPENNIDILPVVGLFLKDVLSVVASSENMVNSWCYSYNS
jgi:hypothetical protein